MEAITTENLVGCRVSHYAIADLIGSGSMGHVYRALDEWLCRDVAVKVLSEATGGGRSRRRSLLVEGRAMSRVSHPHVAAIHDLITDAGRDFLIMEFVAGATLREVVAGGPLPLPEVIRLGRQMADGLAAAHGERVIHRDIKPTNVKITSAGQLKILDFGLAVLKPAWRRLDGTVSSSSTHEVAGTMPYMAPEQLRGEEPDERSDIFSAGAVLYEMATGRPAFPQRQVAQLIDAILNHEPPDVTVVNPLAPLSLQHVIERALEKNPADRYQTAGDLAEALVDLSARAPLRRTPGTWVAGLWR